MRVWKEISLKEIQDDRELLREFYLDYAKAFEKPCPTCTSKLRHYYQNLIKFIPMETTNKCKLKNGKQIILNGNPFNNATITDADAVKMLQENPKRSVWFEVLPDMPKKKTANKKAVAKKEAEKKAAKK